MDSLAYHASPPPLRLLRSCAIEGCRLIADNYCDLCGGSICVAHGEQVLITDLDLPLLHLHHDAPCRRRLWICMRCYETLRAQAMQEHALQVARRHWITRTTGAWIYDLLLYRQYGSQLRA